MAGPDLKASMIYDLGYPLAVIVRKEGLERDQRNDAGGEYMT
jgi:hypothetical protein